MIDFKTAQVQRHQQNIERYCRLLATELTDLERQYLHKRIAEEYAQLNQLEKAASRATAWQGDTRVEPMASSSDSDMNQWGPTILRRSFEPQRYAALPLHPVTNFRA
jgi:hypothetical protein